MGAGKYARMMRRKSTSTFFFDTFPITPRAVYATEKMTSLAGQYCLRLRNGANTVTADVEFNSDGTITALTPTSNGTFPTVSQCISGNISIPSIWYEQTSGGLDTATSSAINVVIQLDANGKIEIISPSAGGTVCNFQTLQQYNDSQPITIVHRAKYNSGDSNFKRAWVGRNNTNTATLMEHYNIRFAAFGAVTFGTARTITEDIFATARVIQYTGDGSNGNVWVNNLPENPLTMGTNGTDGVFQFVGRTDRFTHFIYFDTDLTSGERTDLYNHINAY